MVFRNSGAITCTWNSRRLETLISLQRRIFPFNFRSVRRFYHCILDDWTNLLCIGEYYIIIRPFAGKFSFLVFFFFFYILRIENVNDGLDGNNRIDSYWISIFCLSSIFRKMCRVIYWIWPFMIWRTRKIIRNYIICCRIQVLSLIPRELICRKWIKSAFRAIWREAVSTTGKMYHLNWYNLLDIFVS